MQLELITDLQASGLEPKDITAREVGPPELAATRTGVSSEGSPLGYVIPYFDIFGNPIAHYRIKLLRHKPKYRQPTGTPPYIYFPKNFQQVLRKSIARQHQKETAAQGYVIITEGEKKSACASLAGFPCCAVGGVDAWRNRLLVLPEGTEIDPGYKSKHVTVRLPPGGVAPEAIESSPLALGLTAIIEIVKKNNLSIIIIYDSDQSPAISQHPVKTSVQKSCARFAHELKYRGLESRQIRQLTLPIKASTTGDINNKVGLDDFIVEHGAQALDDLIQECLLAPNAKSFPRFPDPKEYVNKRLQKTKLSRKELSELGTSILLELDRRGRRICTKGTNELNYFDDDSSTLMQVNLMHKHGAPLHETAFGSFMYQEYGLSAGDQRAINWIATQFTGEEPLEHSATHKVMAFPKVLGSAHGCELAIQLSDSKFAIISPDANNPIDIVSNGSAGILFEQDKVAGLNLTLLKKEIAKQLKAPLKLEWLEVLKEFNLKESDQFDKSVGEKPAMTISQTRIIASLLYYISPWLLRWKGTQLPVELILGEAGSGKSSLYGLRQEILTGKVSLNNLTHDIRDWYAGISQAGGVYIMDNVHFTAATKDFRQRLSDEICRIITEPQPHVEMRKLYTTSTVAEFPVNSIFAVTAIEQPFYNSDLIQRSIILELQAIKSRHDAGWTARQISRMGSREGWLAHHLVVLHKFMQCAITDGAWDDNYMAAHRLVNYEQCFMIMGHVFGIDVDWLPEALTTSTSEHMSETDWVLQGLKEYALTLIKEYPKNYNTKRFSTKDLVVWAQQQEAFYNNGQLINAWRLGRYMAAHASQIALAANIHQVTGSTGKKMFQVQRIQLDK